MTTPLPGPPRPAQPSSATVLIVDDHELLGESLQLSLRTHGFSAHLCRPGTPGAVLAAAGELEPGVVLLDIDLGRDAAGRPIDGVTLVEPLRAAGWPVLMMSGTASNVRIGAALDAGALAWVPKMAPTTVLLRAVRAALSGRDAMPPARRDQLIAVYRQRSAERRKLAAKLDRLTPREYEVLDLLAGGHRAQAVADHFVVSLATVRTQIRAVLTKLEVTSQLEAVALFRSATER
ncbi:response regulator transcription factor [Pseudonocardia lacus]|uniref:response regulator transcription factor n=1 Tax=Pseudonocardia lacus TaxID=2835865 RepID=UPI001BDD89F8|nr:response regulator transcription factor [Pseudonocardia lacus]